MSRVKAASSPASPPLTSGSVGVMVEKRRYRSDRYRLIPVSAVYTRGERLHKIRDRPAVREHWKIESMHWLLDVTFSEDESRFLSENAHTTMNALRKFALTVHKNYLAASGKKRSLKANMLAALIRPENLLDLFAFL